MDNPTEHNISTLPVHVYPGWIKVFIGFIILLTLYSLFLLPKYLYAVKDLNAAKTAFKNKDYDHSKNLYMKVFRVIPSSRMVRIATAEALFLTRKKDDQEFAMHLLEDLLLSNDEFTRLKEIMPIEYQSYFKKRNE